MAKTEFDPQLSEETTNRLADNIQEIIDSHSVNENTLAISEEVVEAWVYHDKDDDTAKEAIRRMLSMKSDILGVRLSTIHFEKTSINDRRVYIPPEKLGKWIGAEVMLGKARIIDRVPVFKMSLKGWEFLATLDVKDREELRAVTRKVGRQYGHKNLTDHQCDAILAEQGPETVNKILQQAVRKELNNGE